jgi:hypothetical protein
MAQDGAPDYYALVSGLYGPGALACWYLSMASCIFNSLTAKRDQKSHLFGLSIEFVALVAYPTIAIGHLLIQINGFPVGYEEYLTQNLLFCRESCDKGVPLPYDSPDGSHLVTHAELYPRILAMIPALRIQDSFFYVCATTLSFVLLTTTKPRPVIKSALFTAGLAWCCAVKIALMVKLGHNGDRSGTMGFPMEVLVGLILHSCLPLTKIYAALISPILVLTIPAIMLANLYLTLIFFSTAVGFIWNILSVRFHSSTSFAFLLPLRSRLTYFSSPTITWIGWVCMPFLIFFITMIAYGAGYLCYIWIGIISETEVSYLFFPRTSISITDLDQAFALSSGLISLLWPILFDLLSQLKSKRATEQLEV